MSDLLIANGVVSVRAPTAEEGGYMGVDRDPWDVLGEHWYARRLPDRIRTIYARMRDRERREVWWPFATDADEPAELLAYERMFDPNRGLIAIRSAYLACMGAPDFRARGVSLGFDIVAPGEWSLLRELSSCAPDVLSRELSSSLNDSCLLNRIEDVDAVTRAYSAATKAGLVEALAFDPRLPVEWVEIARG